MKLYIKEDITTKELINLIEKDNNLKDDSVLRTRNGKPYFKNSNIYFSLSDKDNVVVGVTSTRGVGIDIERFTYRPRVVKYFFNILYCQARSLQGYCDPSQDSYIVPCGVGILVKKKNFVAVFL